MVEDLRRMLSESEAVSVTTSAPRMTEEERAAAGWAGRVAERFVAAAVASARDSVASTVEAALHPLETLAAINEAMAENPVVVGMRLSDALGAKYGEFMAAGAERRAEMLGGLTGEALVGIIGSKGVGAATRAVQASRVGQAMTTSAVKVEPLFARGLGTKEMDPQRFQNIKNAFERQGGIIDQSAEAQRYLQSRGAEAATFDAKTIVFKEHPTNAEVFEEFIHTAQYRTGRATGANITEMEIEAAEKLIRNRHVYGIPNDDVRDTINRLRSLRSISEGGK